MNPLYILPFDHRHTFIKSLFGDVQTLTPEQFQKMRDSGLKPEISSFSQEQVLKIKHVKQLIYQGFKKAIELGVPKEFAAILVDDEFGDEILIDATKNGFITCLAIEKSGQNEFAFQHGDDFATYINKYKPTYAKVLVRYNPDGDLESNLRQQKTLKILSDSCKANNHKFLFELLVPATSEQINLYGQTYDDAARPGLTATAIKQFREAGVEPHVWKLEGMNKAEDYTRVVEVAQFGGRDVGVVVLGRGDNEEHVKHWLEVGSKVNGVIGFAVGRTVFLDAVLSDVSDELKINTIAGKFFDFYNVFVKK